MKRRILPFCAFFIGVVLTAQDMEKRTANLQNASFVDPFICTADDHGQTDPAAGVPFGMAKPAPDTHPLGHSGYDFSSQQILGFSNTRFSGVGCRGVGGNLRTLPFYGTKSPYPEPIGYIKDSEEARPGYFHVQLTNKVKVELTATRQVAVHKYSMPTFGPAGLTIDLASSLSKFIHEAHTVGSKGILTGEFTGTNVCDKGKYTFYYAIATDLDTFEIDKVDHRVTYRFDARKGQEIQVYFSLSTVSPENAMHRLSAVRKRSFESIEQSAFKEWNQMLSVVEVAGGNDDDRRLLYTHLYHALQSPFEIQDTDGSYRGSDGKVYRERRAGHYHGWSIWDTFRTKLPLLSLLYPNRYQDMVHSIKELYLQGKPSWATDREPFLTVRTEHSGIVLLEAYKKGLLPFAFDSIYGQLKDEADKLPFETPDNVLESSYDLWALSEIAKILGHKRDFKQYRRKFRRYRKTWKDKFRTMGANADVMHGDGLYEGTLWQYRWLVPYDIDGIQRLIGGKKAFEDQLDHFFDNELFNMGNQPDIQVPYLYAYTDSPWKTQELTTRLLTLETNNWYGTHKKWDAPQTRKIFQASPEGYISEMDDDAGTMAAWYVWSALGLYPIFPGDTQMAVSTPLFDRITLHLDGKPLIIQVARNTEDAIYIQNVKLNGRTVPTGLIDFNSLADGGVLEIELGEKPERIK